jgi:hypothetical protein
MSMMDGDTDIQKMINFYLTNIFISQTEAPSDECLSYAQDFTSNAYSEAQIAFILFASFGLAFSENGEPIMRDSKSFDLAASHIKTIITKHSKGQNVY